MRNEGSRMLVPVPQWLRKKRVISATELMMPAIDKGWTAKWLNEFCLSHISSHKLPCLGELMEFIESELPIKIAIPLLIREKWRVK